MVLKKSNSCPFNHLYNFKFFVISFRRTIGLRFWNNWNYYFTNLTCGELIMKIMWSLFIHKFTHFTYEYHVLKTCLTHINVLDEVWTYEWINECHMSFASSYKFVCQICFQCKILMCEMCESWLKVFCIISVIKLWDVKFTM
jgi:hypothetical protein